MVVNWRSTGNALRHGVHRCLSLCPLRANFIDDDDHYEKVRPMTTAQTLIVIACVSIVIGAIVILKSCGLGAKTAKDGIDSFERVAGKALETGERIATNFFTGNITHHFRESC